MSILWDSVNQNIKPFSYLLIFIIVSFVSTLGINLPDIVKPIDVTSQVKVKRYLLTYSSTNGDTLFSVSPYDDFAVSRLNTETKISPQNNYLDNPFFKTILSLYDNSIKDADYWNTDTSITNFPEKIVKKYKINEMVNPKYLKNGIKFTNKSIVFDNNGNFYSLNAGPDEIAIIAEITKQRPLYTDELLLESPNYTGILNTESNGLVVFKNTTTRNVIIDPKYYLVLINTDIIDNKSTINYKIFRNYKDFKPNL